MWEPQDDTTGKLQPGQNPPVLSPVWVTTQHDLPVSVPWQFLTCTRVLITVLTQNADG